MSSDDDRQTSAPMVTVEAAEGSASGAKDLLAPVQTAPPSVAEPEMLVEGLRYLQQRIPGFTQVSVREKRSYARAANLDPEFIESGLHAADVWPETKSTVKRSAEELRQEDEEIRGWEQVLVELRALTDGIEAANLKRKHRLGNAILMIYRMLAIDFRDQRPRNASMRPYYENMKSAYLKTQKFRGRKKKKTSEEPPAE